MLWASDSVALSPIVQLLSTSKARVPDIDVLALFPVQHSEPPFRCFLLPKATRERAVIERAPLPGYW